VNVALGWLSLTLISVAYVLIASLITVYFAPAALGSGVAEAMGLMNGVAYPDYISIKTLLVKFFGLALAVAGGICGGKEGPLVHIGSIVGYAVASIPLKCFEYFKNDTEKRKLLAVGIAAGVSAAFGAPIGGSLFAYEISKPNTFWSFSLTWKVFFGASMSTFVLSIWKQMWEGEIAHIKLVNSGSVKLSDNEDLPYLDSVPAAIVIGVLGGIIGALFIRVNNRINYFRKKILNQKWKKVLETVILIILTVSAFWLAAALRQCVPDDEDDFLVKKGIEVKRMICPEGQYSRLATMLFSSQQDMIRTFLSDGNEFLMANILIFFFEWLVFTFITSGTAVPCGIFLPSIIIGCGLGHLIYPAHLLIFGNSTYTMNESTICILGAAAVLSGCTRMTYSLAVIMLETTTNVDLFLPIIFTLFSSYGIGTLVINKSIYGGALRTKNIPILNKKIPR
jgi:H+/Cl- antiporter ClcA